jgi:hypothetical protein
MINNLPLGPIRKRDAKVAEILRKLRDRYTECSASRRRDAMVPYLREVYRRVEESFGTPKEKTQLARLQEATGQKFRTDTTLASALIQLSAPVDRNVRHDWVRVITAAANSKILPKHLRAEIKKANGQKNFSGRASSWG